MNLIWSIPPINMEIVGDNIRKTDKELQKIKENDLFFSNILEYSTQPFGVGYPNGKLGLVNKAFEELTGYSKKELKNLTGQKFLHHQNLEKWKIKNFKNFKEMANQ
jgi:PAS domain-containing protein